MTRLAHANRKKVDPKVLGLNTRRNASGRSMVTAGLMSSLTLAKEHRLNRMADRRMLATVAGCKLPSVIK